MFVEIILFADPELVPVSTGYHFFFIVISSSYFFIAARFAAVAVI